MAGFCGSGELDHVGVELVIAAALGEEVVVVAALDDAAIFQNEDRVGVADGGQAVGNDEDCPALHQAVKTALDELFRSGIDGGGRLVEDEHRRFGHGCARNGEQLALTLREVAPSE